MAHEQKFFRLAVRETDFSNDNSIEELARAAVIGAIGLNLQTDERDEFVEAGLAYLDNFESYAASAISELEAEMDYLESELPESESKVGQLADAILRIRELMRETLDIDRVALGQLFEADWDERHEEDLAA